MVVVRDCSPPRGSPPGSGPVGGATVASPWSAPVRGTGPCAGGPGSGGGPGISSSATGARDRAAGGSPVPRITLRRAGARGLNMRMRAICRPCPRDSGCGVPSPCDAGLHIEAEHDCAGGGQRVGPFEPQVSAAAGTRRADQLVRARTSFLVDDAVEAGAVRDTILASWTRSREWDVPVRQHRAVLRVRLRAGLPADQGGRAGAGRRVRPVRRRTGQRDPHRLRRSGAGAAHRRLRAAPAPGQGVAGPRLLLRREVRRHERHRHRAGGPRAGPGVRARALRGAAGRPGLCRAPRSGTR